MPNLNFTSSSFAQQDRYAQTTVSYESRNMQSIPFYPGVDHKAKMRGIMAATLIITVIIGAIFGTLFGLRDYIIDWFNETPTYLADADDDTDAGNPPDKDSMNVSSSDMTNVDYVVINSGSSDKDVVYSGAEQTIEWGVSSSVTDPGDVKVSFTWQKIQNDSPKSVDTYGWPINAGSYLIKAYITVDGENAGDRTIILNIAKAAIDEPVLVLPDLSDRTYNREIKSIDLKESLPADYTGDWKISYTFEGKKYTHSKNGIVQTSTAVKNAGTYVFSIEISGDDNYVSKTFTDVDTLVIKKSSEIKPIHFDSAFTEKTFVYDGTVKGTTINFELLGTTGEHLLTDDIRDDFMSGSSVTYSSNITDPTAVGTYLITAVISSKNYDIEKVQTTITIEPANLTDFFTFNNVTTTYNGSKVDSSDLTIKWLSDIDLQAEGIIPKYTYYTSKGTVLSGGAADIINAGTYKAEVTFVTGDNYNTPDPIEITITIKKADIDPQNVKVTPLTDVTYTGRSIAFPTSNITIEGLKQAIDYNNIKIEYPEIINAGRHSIIITIKESTNYNKLEIETYAVVNRAEYSDPYITYTPIQYTTKEGSTQFTPQIFNIPEGFWVEYWVGGEQVEGFSRLGTYDVKVVVTDGNREQIIDKIQFTVKFNWLTILMGIVLGVVAALIIAPSIWGGYRIVEKRSFKRFARLRARILHERGGARGAIVCEGHTMILNWNSEQEIRDFPWIIEPRFGRLYLTHATIEYYDNNYKKNYRNVLVQLKDVTGVEIRGAFLRNKLIVFSRGGRHVFYVAPNTAYLWRRDITHFRNLQHLYPMENNVVDNDYPFNYTVVSDAD